MSNAIRSRTAGATREKRPALCYKLRREGSDDMSADKGKTVVRRRSTEPADRYGRVQTEIGELWVAFSSRGVRMIRPGDERALDFEGAFRRRFGRCPVLAAVPGCYARLVRHAAAGRPQGKPQVDLRGLRPFEIRVLDALREIPRGQVRTYAWLARQAGSPGAARAAGNAMARNPVPLLLPCHRVVPARGGLGGYAFGPAIKRELLRREGLSVAWPERPGRPRAAGAGKP